MMRDVTMAQESSQERFSNILIYNLAHLPWAMIKI